jgi:Tol biopolymer transport system component/DNA-binding winged helix-turn-helix (wHTH) protein
MIDAPSSATRIVRFGPFELDLRSGELRKNGSRVGLQDQPLQILSVLVERPGELVTREELRQRLWPAETYVDFEHGLNAAVKRLRDALGDSADTPRFVETVPRRGYRFIAPVDVPRPAKPVEPAVEHKPRPPFRRWHVVAVVLVLLSAIVAVMIRRSDSPRVLRYTALTRDEVHLFPPGLSGGVVPLLTDGSRVYFTEWVKDGLRVPRQVSVAGGGTVALFAVPEQNYLAEAISPDGSQLLIGAFPPVQGASFMPPEVPYCILPVLGGAPRRLGDVKGHAAAWSSDGRITYAKGNDLYMTDSEGREPRKILTAPSRPYWPRWSPDGKRLRFSATDFDSGVSSLWEAAADGRGLRRLLPGWSNPPSECCGDWTPDGRYFVFQVTRQNETHLWVIKERPTVLDDTPRPIQLTTGPMSFMQPVPSKDGRKLFTIGCNRRGELARYEAGSGRFMPFLSGLSAEWLDFSRDGQWVSFITFPEGELWRSRADGSQRIKLASAPVRSAGPRWSPDGSRIVFTSQMPGRRWKLYMVGRDGGTVQRLLPGDHREGDPTWSPDGRSLAFGMEDAIYIVDLESRQLSKVPGSDGLFSPRWSPDGRHLAAMPIHAEKQLVFEFGTARWKDLAEVRSAYPNWSHDGRYLYFLSAWETPFFPGSAAANSVSRIRISDAKMERVVNLEGLRQAQGINGSWLGLAPDDSPIVLRDLSSQEIYALDWEAP